MKTSEAFGSALLFGVGTFLKFVGVFTAAAVIGIPLFIVGYKMQEASERIGD